MGWFRRQRRIVQGAIGCGGLLMVCSTLTVMVAFISVMFDDPDDNAAADVQSTATVARGLAVATHTPTLEPAHTATAVPTNTPVPSTATPEPTATPIPPTETALPTEIPPTPTMTPAPTATPLPYTLPREYAEFFDGFSLTVTEWYTVMNNAGEPYSIRDGMRFIYVNTMSCAGAVQFSVSPGDFQLEMPNNRRANFTVVLGMSDDGRLRPSTIASGDCVQGRVYFEIPTDEDPVYVIYTGFLRGQTKFLAVSGDE